MTEDSVLLERRGHAFWITINRPAKRNALNPATLAGIAEGWRTAQADPQIRVIVLTGAGDKAFCAGADLEPGQAFSFDYSQPTTDYANLLRLADSCNLPSISVVNGACLAGGMGLLAMTDLAVAVDSAVFGLPEVRVGVFPVQVLALLQHIVPTRPLREWCLTGEIFNAATAAANGLVNYIVPGAELLNQTELLIKRITAGSPAAMRRGKHALRALQSLSVEEALVFAESQIPLFALTADAREGVAAFLEGRKPSFTGR